MVTIEKPFEFSFILIFLGIHSHLTVVIDKTSDGALGRLTSPEINTDVDMCLHMAYDLKGTK